MKAKVCHHNFWKQKAKGILVFPYNIKNNYLVDSINIETASKFPVYIESFWFYQNWKLAKIIEDILVESTNEGLVLLSLLLQCCGTIHLHSRTWNVRWELVDRFLQCLELLYSKRTRRVWEGPWKPMMHVWRNTTNYIITIIWTDQR